MSRWRSGGEPIRSESRENLAGALGDGISGVREQISAINRSDRGKLLLIGDILLQAAESLPGRTLIALLSLWGAWALLH